MSKMQSCTHLSVRFRNSLQDFRPGFEKNIADTTAVHVMIKGVPEHVILPKDPVSAECKTNNYSKCLRKFADWAANWAVKNKEFMDADIETVVPVKPVRLSHVLERNVLKDIRASLSVGIHLGRQICQHPGYEWSKEALDDFHQKLEVAGLWMFANTPLQPGS
jgi:hypothetical protein